MGPELQLACFHAGDGLISIQIQVRGNGTPRLNAVTDMLNAIADAAIKQAKLVSSPGRLKLPLLDIQIPVRTGTWGVISGTDAFGTHDVVSRAATSQTNGLFITPMFLGKDPLECRQLMANSPMTAGEPATLMRARRYGSPPWYPDAWETFPPPFRFLQAFVCRDIGEHTPLLVRIEYEKAKFTESDVAILHQLLDDIGAAVDRKVAATPAR
jgi:hypothetical protein